MLVMPYRLDVHDVSLLDGDKIPLIKSDTSWTSSLYGMTSMLTGQVKAKSSNEGIGYKMKQPHTITELKTKKGFACEVLLPKSRQAAV